MLDDDLWLLEPELRYGFEGEEAVEEWREATRVFLNIAGIINDLAGPGAVAQTFQDAHIRAEEMYRRAQERLEEAE